MDLEMNKKQQGNMYWQLSWAMIKTGILGFGGGPSVIPLIRYEAVNHYKWIDDDEFGEILGLANALPGPIATKIAAYLGYRQKGVLGAAVAVLGHIVPSALAMIILLTTVQFLSSAAWVQGMISAVIPVVTVMLGIMAYEFGEKAIKGLGIPFGIATFLIAFGLLQGVKLHPAIVIIIFLGYGAFHMRTLAAWKRRRARQTAVRQKEESTHGMD